MRQDEIEAVLADALYTLYRNDRGMIERSAAERAITGRLARYLEDRLGGYDVTVEYDRHGVEPKEVELPDGSGVLTLARVMPDIIVHRLGNDDDNLLVVEAKKTTNTTPDRSDILKLEAIKARMSYRFAVFLRLPVGEGAGVEGVRATWV